MVEFAMQPVRWLAAFTFAVATAARVGASDLTDVDRAFYRLYSYDFAGAHALLDEALSVRPDDPLLHAVRGAVLLFSEFDRLQILELEFFADDDKVTDGKRLRPDPAARERLFHASTEARRLALGRLAIEPDDRDAMFALCIAIGTESDYFAPTRCPLNRSATPAACSTSTRRSTMPTSSWGRSNMWSAT